MGEEADARNDPELRVQERLCHRRSPGQLRENTGPRSGRGTPRRKRPLRKCRAPRQDCAIRFPRGGNQRAHQRHLVSIAEERGSLLRSKRHRFSQPGSLKQPSALEGVCFGGFVVMSQEYAANTHTGTNVAVTPFRRHAHAGRGTVLHRSGSRGPAIRRPTLRFPMRCRADICRAWRDSGRPLQRPAQTRTS